MALGLNIPPDPSALRLLLRALFEQRWKLRQLAERSEIRVPLHVVEVVEPGGDSFWQTVEGLLALGMLPRQISR